MNLCARQGIPVWDCRREGTDAVGYTTVSGYHRLHLLMRENHIRLRVIQKSGARFIGHRYRKRVGILTGILLFAASLFVAQLFVWEVQVDGCSDPTSQNRLYQVLAEQGVRRGCLKSGIDLYLVARTAEVEVNGLSWAALNLHGTTAILKVRERTPPPQKIDTSVPANVVAVKDGQIVTLRVTDGRPLLRSGDAVRAGELIVSGVLQDQWGVTHLVRANAKAIAHVPASLTVEVPLQQESAVYTGHTVRRNYLELFSLRLPLFLYTGLEGTYRVEKEQNPLVVGAKELPVALAQERFVFYETKETAISQEAALKIAEKKLARMEETEFAESKILSRETFATCENGILSLRGEYELEQDIAKQVEIGVLERAKTQKPLREGGY